MGEEKSSGLIFNRNYEISPEVLGISKASVSLNRPVAQTYRSQAYWWWIPFRKYVAVFMEDSDVHGNSKHVPDHLSKMKLEIDARQESLNARESDRDEHLRVSWYDIRLSSQYLSIAVANP